MGGEPVPTCLNPCSFYLSHTTKKKIRRGRERGWHSSHRSWESGHTYHKFPTILNFILCTFTSQIHINDVLPLEKVMPLRSAWHCCAMAGLPGALNPQSRVAGVSCVFVGWSTGLGRRMFVVATPGSLGSSSPSWVRHCLRYLGGSGSLAPLHTGVTHSSRLDAWWYL